MLGEERDTRCPTQIPWVAAVCQRPTSLRGVPSLLRGWTSPLEELVAFREYLWLTDTV